MIPAEMTESIWGRGIVPDGISYGKYICVATDFPIRFQVVQNQVRWKSTLADRHLKRRLEEILALRDAEAAYEKLIHQVTHRNKELPLHCETFDKTYSQHEKNRLPDIDLVESPGGFWGFECTSRSTSSHVSLLEQWLGILSEQDVGAAASERPLLIFERIDKRNADYDCFRASGYPGITMWLVNLRLLMGNRRLVESLCCAIQRSMDGLALTWDGGEHFLDTLYWTQLLELVFEGIESFPYPCFTRTSTDRHLWRYLGGFAKSGCDWMGLFHREWLLTFPLMDGVLCRRRKPEPPSFVRVLSSRCSVIGVRETRVDWSCCWEPGLILKVITDFACGWFKRMGNAMRPMRFVDEAGGNDHSLGELFLAKSRLSFGAEEVSVFSDFSQGSKDAAEGWLTTMVLSWSQEVSGFAWTLEREQCPRHEFDGLYTFSVGHCGNILDYRPVDLPLFLKRGIERIPLTRDDILCADCEFYISDLEKGWYLFLLWHCGDGGHKGVEDNICSWKNCGLRSICRQAA